MDFEAVLSRAPQDEDPRRLFVDYVHPSAEGHRLLAGLLEPWAACARRGDCPPRPDASLARHRR